jgi:hypothetical protein
MPRKTTGIKNKCLNCNEELHRATAVEHDIPPHEGAIAVCSNCGHVMAFDGQGKFRELTNEEIKEVAGNKSLLAAQKIAEHIKLEQDLEKEILPLFTDVMDKMEIQIRQEKMPASLSLSGDTYGWFARDGSDPSSYIGFGDTEKEAVKDLLTETLKRLVDATYKRKRRN